MEKILSNYFNNDNVILTDRGFLGLYVAFQNLRKNTDKRQILFTSITCPFPVYAAVFAGFTPLFTDINMENFLMDFNEIERMIAVNKNIAAIVYIYIFGHISNDIIKIKELIKDKDVILIEDVAQAFGCEVSDKKAGTIGDISIFSFGYSKQIDIGGGGGLLINSGKFYKNELQERLNKINRYNINSTIENVYRTEFYKLREKAINNSILYKLYNKLFYKYKRMFFKKIDVDWNIGKKRITEFINNNERSIRNHLAFCYQKGLANITYSDKFILPEITDNCSIWRYSFLVKNKYETRLLTDNLRENGINCSNHYLPVSRFFYNHGFENSIEFAQKVINLWVDNSVDILYIDKTLNLINKFYSKNS